MSTLATAAAKNGTTIVFHGFAENAKFTQKGRMTYVTINTKVTSITAHDPSSLVMYAVDPTKTSGIPIVTASTIPDSVSEDMIVRGRDITSDDLSRHGRLPVVLTWTAEDGSPRVYVLGTDRIANVRVFKQDGVFPCPVTGRFPWFGCRVSANTDDALCMLNGKVISKNTIDNVLSSAIYWQPKLAKGRDAVSVTKPALIEDKHVPAIVVGTLVKDKNIGLYRFSMLAPADIEIATPTGVEHINKVAFVAYVDTPPKLDPDNMPVGVNDCFAVTVVNPRLLPGTRSVVVDRIIVNDKLEPDQSVDTDDGDKSEAEDEAEDEADTEPLSKRPRHENGVSAPPGVKAAEYDFTYWIVSSEKDRALIVGYDAATGETAAVSVVVAPRSQTTENGDAVPTMEEAASKLALHHGSKTTAVGTLPPAPVLRVRGATAQDSKMAVAVRSKLTIVPGATVKPGDMPFDSEAFAKLSMDICYACGRAAAIGGVTVPVVIQRWKEIYITKPSDVDKVDATAAFYRDAVVTAVPNGDKTPRTLYYGDIAAWAPDALACAAGSGVSPGKDSDALKEFMEKAGPVTALVTFSSLDEKYDDSRAEQEVSWCTKEANKTSTVYTHGSYTRFDGTVRSVVPKIKMMHYTRLPLSVLERWADVTMDVDTLVRGITRTQDATIAQPTAISVTARARVAKATRDCPHVEAVTRASARDVSRIVANMADDGLVPIDVPVYIKGALTFIAFEAEAAEDDDDDDAADMDLEADNDDAAAAE